MVLKEMDGRKRGLLPAVRVVVLQEGSHRILDEAEQDAGAEVKGPERPEGDYNEIPLLRLGASGAGGAVAAAGRRPGAY